MVAFLENIVLIWLHGRESLLGFPDYVNLYYELIKYTWGWSYEKLSYLDVVVMVQGNKISTDVYCKPTDTHQHLHYGCCNPTHVKKGIPCGQALRVKRICSTEEGYRDRLRDLCSNFIKRGFKENLVDSEFERARVKTRESLLCQDSNRRDHKINKRLPLVMTFHPALLGVGKIIHSLWPILHASEDMRSIIEEKPMIVYRRPKNLKDNLVRSKLKGGSGDKGMRKCGKSRCQIYNFVEEGSKFCRNGRILLYYLFDCDSAGVIYVIICKKCSKIYMGSTITSFRRRFNNHKSSVKRYGNGERGIPGEHLYAHFYERGHEGIKDMLVKIVDRTDVSDPTKREGFWAYKLDSFVPKV